MGLALWLRRVPQLLGGLDVLSKLTSLAHLLSTVTLGNKKATVFKVKRNDSHSCRSYASPGRAMFEHGVEDDEQFAHTRDEGHLLRFASRQQPLVEVTDDGVVAGCGQRPHVKGAPHSGAPAPDSAFAPAECHCPG